MYPAHISLERCLVNECRDDAEPCDAEGGRAGGDFDCLFKWKTFCQINGECGDKSVRAASCVNGSDIGSREKAGGMLRAQVATFVAKCDDRDRNAKLEEIVRLILDLVMIRAESSCGLAVRNKNIGIRDQLLRHKL